MRIIFRKNSMIHGKWVVLLWVNGYCVLHRNRLSFTEGLFQLIKAIIR